MEIGGQIGDKVEFELVVYRCARSGVAHTIHHHRGLRIMAWLELKPNGKFHVVFRLGGRKVKRWLGTADGRGAKARLLRLEENISLVQSERPVIPEDADVAAFLLSAGRINGDTVRLPQLRTLGQFTGHLLPKNCSID